MYLICKVHGYADCDRNTTNPDCHMVYWVEVGEWSYPTKRNSSFKEVFYHAWCKEQRKSAAFLEEDDLAFTHCTTCAKKVPDGLKMIALLEKL